MARITRVRISNYRSIADPIEIRFPSGSPVVLLGENNTGKSNIVRAIKLILGPPYPSTYEPDDNEFYGRKRVGRIDIRVEFDPAHAFGDRYHEVFWTYTPDVNPPQLYRGRPGPGDGGYISNEDRDTCMCVALEADRNLHFHLGYSSKWSFLSRLMHRFHKALLAQPDTKADLEQLFAQTKAKFREIPEFVTFIEMLQTQLGSLVASMTHRLEVDFAAYNPVNFFHALRLQAAEAGEVRSLEEMGTGEQQILALVFAHAYAQAFHGGVLLIVEEPEAHLHPLAQDWLSRRLHAMASDGLQILLTTHSPSFVDIRRLEGLVLVRKQDGATAVTQVTIHDLIDHCVQTGVPAHLITEANVLPFYAAASTRAIMEGFFAKVVVLVEGPTEALSLPVYLEKCGFDTSREGVALIPVFGKGSLARWKRLFEVFGIPTYMVFDNDNRDDEEGAKRRDALQSLGVDEEQRGALLGEADWIVREDFAIFGSDFETVLRGAFPGYEDVEEALAMGGAERKPFMAREVASRLPFDPTHVGWVRMNEIATMLKSKLVAGEPAGLPDEDPADPAREGEDLDVPF